MSTLPPKADIGTGPHYRRRSNSGSFAMCYAAWRFENQAWLGISEFSIAVLLH